MAYEPTEWKNGEIITAEKMNKIETELASRFLIITVENGHLSRTWQEIYDALRAQRIPMIFHNVEEPFAVCGFNVIANAMNTGNTYQIFSVNNVDSPDWKATAPEEYPIPYSNGSGGGDIIK